MEKEEKKKSKLTDKDKVKRFIDEYIKDFNATQAAKRAGYSEHTAYSIGWENLRKPEIKAAIEERIKELSMGSEETLKAISDIAKASLNDYFIVKEVVRTPQVEKSLKALIKEIKDSMEDADKFIVKAKIADQDEIERHNKSQESKRREIILLEIELERDPKATRFVDGKPELVKVAELDLVRLVQDKEAGKIKSVKHSEHGLNVEMYPADSALTNLAKIHGLFEKDNDQKALNITTGAKIVRISRKKDE